MHAKHLCFLAPLALALHACSDDDGHDFGAAATARAERPASGALAAVVFDPAAGAAGLPFPNDLLFLGTQDGTLNVPIEGADEDPSLATDLSNPRVALNQMDGFSTTAPITTSVTASLDPSSLRLGETIRVFELEGEGEEAPTLGAELGPETLVSVERDNTLALLPLTPLAPATRYAVFVTDGVTGTDGVALDTSGAFRFIRGASPLVGNPTPGSDEAVASFLLDDPTDPDELEQLGALEQLRQSTRSLIEQLVGQSEGTLAPQNVALAWTFRTQGIREVLGAVAEASVPSSLRVVPSSTDTSALPGGRGLADIFVGALDVPYYQVPLDTSAVTAEGTAAALNGFWVPASGRGEFVTRFDPLPLSRGDQTIPVLMTVPNASSGQGMPATGWPVVIFQHGITGNRGNALPLADAMAAAGFVVVAIDLPLHGIADTDEALAALRAGAARLGATERTFDIDIGTFDGRVETPGAGRDGEIDPSGQYFYNLRNLASARDNLRQAIADLFTLNASLGNVQLVDPSAPGAAPAPFPIDTSRKAFVGHSLGAIVGTTFLSYVDDVRSATLATPGGGIARLLAASPAFGPTILAGVTAGNDGTLTQAEYQQFLTIAQTLVDSGDPINHARLVAEGNATPLHLIEVVGEPDGSPPDQVIPNAVDGAPLSGTEPLADELGLIPERVAVEDTSGSALVRFSRGTHGSLLDPTPVPAPDGAAPTEEALDTGRAVTGEMQSQTADFAESGGQTLPIGNAALIAPSDVEIRPAMLPSGDSSTANASAR